MMRLVRYGNTACRNSATQHWSRLFRCCDVATPTKRARVCVREAHATPSHWSASQHRNTATTRMGATLRRYARARVRNSSTFFFEKGKKI